MEDTNLNFLDAESQGPDYMKDKISFRDIVLQQVKRVTNVAAVEFHGGFYETKPHPNPNVNTVLKTYVADSREIFCNSVEILADLLFPYFDDDMKTDEEAAAKERDAAYKKRTVINKVGDGEYEYKYEDSKINWLVDRVEIDRLLFRALCAFLYRIKYLELGKAED